MHRPQAHRSYFAILAAAAVAILPLSTAQAADSFAGNNASGAAPAPSATSQPLAMQVTGSIKAFAQPTAKYRKKMCLADLSAISDFTPVSEVVLEPGQKCHIHNATLDPAMEKRSVPASWATWGSPPNTESSTPDILYSVGSTTSRVSFFTVNCAAGVEVE